MSRRDFLFFVPVATAWARRLDVTTFDNSLRSPVFSEVASDVGLNFHHFNGATGEYFMPEIMGAGAALLDYDNDGALDIYLVQGTLLDARKGAPQPLFPPPAGWKPGNRLFRNELMRTGHLKFTDVTEQAGLTSAGYGMGVATGDYDNDGFMDLFVTNFGRNILYHNNGDGTFKDVTRQSGLENKAWATSALGSTMTTMETLTSSSPIIWTSRSRATSAALLPRANSTTALRRCTGRCQRDCSTIWGTASLSTSRKNRASEPFPAPVWVSSVLISMATAGWTSMLPTMAPPTTFGLTRKWDLQGGRFGFRRRIQW